VSEKNIIQEYSFDNLTWEYKTDFPITFIQVPLPGLLILGDESSLQLEFYRNHEKFASIIQKVPSSILSDGSYLFFQYSKSVSIFSLETLSQLFIIENDAQLISQALSPRYLITSTNCRIYLNKLENLPEFIKELESRIA
jgi:hypothetical protein